MNYRLVRTLVNLERSFGYKHNDTQGKLELTPVLCGKSIPEDKVSTQFTDTNKKLEYYRER